MTPAFIGTAETARAEWSGKSIRGQLRWWFRAVAGGETDPADVPELERAIFGSNEGRSALRVIVAGGDSRPPGAQVESNAFGPAALSKQWGKGEAPDVVERLRLAANPIAYLGYGPIESRQGALYARGRIPEGTNLTLYLRWPGREPLSDLFERALWCWLNLGGIGARSRRGFGSLTAQDSGVGVDGFKSEAREILKRVNANSARWTHFTKQSRIFISSEFTTWFRAMEAAGAWLIAFRRRYGISNDERGAAVQNRDYAWLKGRATPTGMPDRASYILPPVSTPSARVLSRATPTGMPDRAGFGLPLPFGGTREKVVSWSDGNHRDGRRASPLLIHIATFGPQDYRVVLTHLPADLVPPNANLHFMGATGGVTTEQKTIVQRFLDDLEGKHLIEAIR